MTFSQRIEASKPYLVGFVLGVVVAPIVGFSMGWVSTSSARMEAVETARVDTLASVCSEAAQKTWASEKMEPAALKGWDNRAKREELVSATLTSLSVPEALMQKVTRACDRTLA